MPIKSDQPLTPDELKELARIERARELSMERYLRMRVGDRAIALQKRVEARRDAEWIAGAIAEAAALAALRGDVLDRAKGDQGPMERPSPLLKLYRAGIITQEQFGAGGRYGKVWRRLYAHGKGQGGRGELDPLESRIADLRKLDDARGYTVGHDGKSLVPTGLMGDARLISLVDDVCGAEKSLRETIGTNGHKRRVAMERLHYALGLLALHYGLIKTRESEMLAA